MVQVQHYETTQWLLIDALGKQIELWGAPLFAPDKKHLVAICAGIEYSGGQPNIIQLLEVEKGGLRLVWKLEPESWEPARISWTTASTLILSKTMWTGKNPGSTNTYSKLIIQ
ncbi:MAG: hypothetical protein JWR44_2840 [Hymenobacter sp.]|jgi:hypothetical protein|nr:hypothetical protein [Hymenobacter sp.]